MRGVFSVSFKPVDDSESRDAPFNMAMLFYINLNKMVERKDEAYFNNDLAEWYKGLNRIFTKIVFKMNKAEEQELRVMFFSGKYHIENGGGLANEILHRIDVKLMKLMDRYKMIFPNIDITKGLEKLKKRYKLDDNNP